ncbi:hypothetical protein DJ480_17510 [Pseudomonas sp. Leaf98]|nr:hypothetical protein DJ480_17510 [Pseudomonas sp. Leaf98]
MAGCWAWKTSSRRCQRHNDWAIVASRLLWQTGLLWKTGLLWNTGLLWRAGLPCVGLRSSPGSFCLTHRAAWIGAASPPSAGQACSPQYAGSP